MLPRDRTTSSTPKKPDPGAPDSAIGNEATIDASGADGEVQGRVGAAPASGSQSALPRQQVACVGMRLGRYELVGELGEGGMATVFEARDTQLKRMVAVKVMFPHLARRKEAASRFKREARAAAGLDHDHILRVFDVGGGEVVDGLLVPPYIVLELIEGASLAELFEDSAAPLAEIVAAIGVAVCRALAVAHAQSIVHRDIKPANIMVTTKGRLVLADFGVARVGDDDSVVTRTGAILGTPAYMSPEQACSDPVDVRSDLYSLGATLHRLATGSLPYAGTTAQVVTAMLEGQRRPVEAIAPAMGRELSRVIDTMMQRDVGDRYQTPQEAEAALMEVVTGAGFPDPDTLLVDYFCDPEGSVAGLRSQAISGNLRRARKLADEKRVPLALSLAQRVLQLEPANLQAQTLVNVLGRRQGQRVWIAIVAPMVVTAFVGIFFVLTQPDRVVSTYSDAGVADASYLESDVASDIRPQPDAAPETTDAGPRDAAPSGKTSATPRPNRRLPPSRPDAATPMRVEPAPAILPDPAEPAAKAHVVVDIKPWCDVAIDGKAVGRASPTTSYELAAGPHTITCLQPGTGLSWQQDVVLAPGERKKLEGTVLSPITVRLALGRGQRAKIGKQRAANGGELRLPGGRYLVEVYKPNGEILESRYLVLRDSCTLKDQPRIACFTY